MSFSIYELTEDYMNLLAMAEDPDIDEQAFMDTLEGIEGALEDKADGYAKVMKQLEANADGMEAEIKRLQERKSLMAKNVDRMKSTLQKMMETTGKEKFKTELFSFHIQNNPPSLVMDSEDIEVIPMEYLVPQDPKIDKTKIKADIKAGKEITFAHMVTGRSLRIK